MNFLATLPNFLLYFVLSGTLAGIFLTLYVKITPYAEFTLIKQGLIAPAISLSGSLLGFVIALGSVIKHSVNIIDMLIWGVIAMMVQLMAFGLVRLIFPSLTNGIASNNIAKAIFLAAVSLVFGLLNAACMSY